MPRSIARRWPSRQQRPSCSKGYGAAARCVATNRFNRLIVRKRRNDTDLIVIDGRGGETLDVNPLDQLRGSDVLGRLLMRLRETETEVPLLR